jgi:hypothetical protein
VNGASKRCASTTWKISPAAMYSFARATMAWNSLGVVFEVGGTSSAAARSLAGSLTSGRSRASTTAVSRSTARLNARSAGSPAAGRTGVTRVMVSSTESKMITTVGRTRMASGIPIGSGLGAGSSSISRTMS